MKQEKDSIKKAISFILKNKKKQLIKLVIAILLIITALVLTEIYYGWLPVIILLMILYATNIKDSAMNEVRTDKEINNMAINSTNKIAKNISEITKILQSIGKINE